MMISPESYVEMELVGKPADKILSKIRGLKQEISKIRNQAEDPYNQTDIICPSPQVRIDVMRDYLAEAKKYYASIGGEYIPSASEKRAEAFDSNMEHISVITISYGGYFGGAETRTLTREGEKIIVEREFYNGAFDDGRALYEDMKWEDLLENLSYVHMGEWKTKYDDPDTLDGTQWSVDIKYDNGITPKHYWGSNRFPYNFERFLELMEMV